MVDHYTIFFARLMFPGPNLAHPHDNVLKVHRLYSSSSISWETVIAK